ncbi:MAG: formylglycine-generating enzyme family protein [Bacteroidales bacterium]|nr:formylglycine-generating enzyme family protein [Bacteroidales bacterium]
MKKLLATIVMVLLGSFVLAAQNPTRNILDIPMVVVAGGTFEMGGIETYGEQCYPDEFPKHTVTVDDYYIGQFEVTQELYKFVMGYNPSHFVGDSLPVDNISWVDAKTFIHELNKMTGKQYRLPTEAEWEFAARGGRWSQDLNYSGSDDLNAVGWCDGNSGRRTHAVGTKAPNELDIYDMCGNVYEWCQDRYAIYKADPQTNPQGPDFGKARVMRGGSWRSEARNCRNTYRSSEDYEARILNCGLRLAMDYE